MNLYKRANSPFYWLDYTDPRSGQRVRTSTRQTTQVAAKRAAQGIMSSPVVAPVVPTVPDTAPTEDRDGKQAITIRAALEAYVSSLEVQNKAYAGTSRAIMGKTIGLAPEGTQRAPRWSLDGNRYLHTLTPTDISEMIQARYAEGNKAQTVAHEIKLMRAAVNRLADLQAYRLPVMTQKSWQMPRLVAKTRYLSWAEWKLVYEQLDPARPIVIPDHTFKTARGVHTRTGRVQYAKPGTLQYDRMQTNQDLLVALTLTGGRWSEIRNLTWDRIDTAGWERITLWGSKTQAERQVPLPALFKDVLRRRWSERGHGVSLVFPGADGSSVMNATSNAIKEAIDRAGLNGPHIVAQQGAATVHSLRHTFASLLIQSGAGLSDVKDALGHKSITTTMRYAHLDKAQSIERMAKMIDAMGTV